jgi:hypothetical protein
MARDSPTSYPLRPLVSFFHPTHRCSLCQVRNRIRSSLLATNTPTFVAQDATPYLLLKNPIHILPTSSMVNLSHSDDTFSLAFEHILCLPLEKQT